MRLKSLQIEDRKNESMQGSKEDIHDSKVNNRREERKRARPEVETQGTKKRERPILRNRKVSSPYNFSFLKTLVRRSRPLGCGDQNFPNGA